MQKVRMAINSTENRGDKDKLKSFSVENIRILKALGVAEE